MPESIQTKQYSIFCVNEEPYCLWDIDIKALNLEFLDRFDPQYFEYIADVNRFDLEGKEKHWSATATRLSFFHGLETFFALVCATLQAPDCIPGWMQRYTNPILRQMISSINNGTAKFPCKYIIPEIKWTCIASLVLSKVDTSVEERTEYIALFTRLWHRFSEIFIDEKSTAEYNSLKHGFRTKSGGFSLLVGLGSNPNVPPPPDKVHVLGSSEISHSFFQVAPVGDIKQNPNFQLMRHSTAWNPVSMASALDLISCSIKNLVTLNKIANGVDNSYCQFSVPSDKSMFQKPFQDSPSIQSFSMNFDLKTAKVFTREELLNFIAKNK